MADARQISVRLAIEGAEQARAQLEAVRESAKKAGEEGAPTAAQLRQWDSLQRSVDSNHAAAARYADTVRRVQAAEAAGLGTAEQRNRVLEQAALAHQRATTSMEVHAQSTRGYGMALGQAGFQVQDFATQVAMGQNAVTAFGVQFAQFAGIFGVGGAIAGAVVTVGLLGAQFLGLSDKAETLDDAIKQVEDSYKRMNDVAERRIKGVEEEAEALNRLVIGYSSLSAAGQRGELLMVERQRNALGAQNLQIQQQSVPRGVREMVSPTTGAVNPMGDATGLTENLPGSNEAYVDVLRQALAAYDAQSRVTAEGQRALAVSLDAAARAAGENGTALYRQRDAVLETIPAAVRLEEAQRQVAAQALAAMHAMGMSQSVIDTYLASFGNLAEEIVRTALALQTLGRIASENPFASLDQEVARTEAQLAALRTGGLEALEATRQRQAVEQAGAAANQRVFDQEMRNLRERGALNDAVRVVRAEEERAAENQARALRERGEGEAEIRRLTAQRMTDTQALAQAEDVLQQRAAAAAQAAQARAEAGVRATQALTREQREAEEAARAAERAQRDAARAGEQEAQRQVRAFDQAEALARRTAQQAITAGRREQDRSQAQAERDAERQAEREQRRQDETAREWSRGLADATFAGLQAGFGRGEGVAQAFARVLGNVVQRALSNVLAEQVFMPIVSGVIGGGAGGAGGAVGSAGGGGGLPSILSGGGMLLNAGGMLSSGAEYLGFGGFGGLGSLSGLMSAPIFGEAALAGATNSALAGMGAGVYGPATAGAVGLPGVSFGGALAGIGGGFMIGSTVGGMLAGRSAARAQNAQIGAGLGAVGGFLIGGPIGGLIGGSLGGAAGGLIGPGPKTHAFGFSLDASGGRFGTSGLQTTGNGNGGPEVMAQAQAYAEQINAFLEANKIIVAAGNRVINGQTNSEDQSKTFNDAFKVFRFNSGAGGTIDRLLKDRSFDSPEALTKAVDFAAVYDVLSGIKKPTDQWAQQIEALNKTFEDATKKAKDFGLATDVLATGQAKATAIINAQRETSILGGLLGQSRVLTGFLDSRFGAGGSPQTQFAQAQEQYEAALSAARKATAETADLQRYTAAANTLLNASSSFFGSGAQAAAIESMVRTQTIALGQALDLPAFTTDVTGAIERAASRQIDQLQQLNATVALLRDEARAQRLVIERLLAA